MRYAANFIWALSSTGALETLRDIVGPHKSPSTSLGMPCPFAREPSAPLQAARYCKKTGESMHPDCITEQPSRIRILRFVVHPTESRPP